MEEFLGQVSRVKAHVLADTPMPTADLSGGQVRYSGIAEHGQKFSSGWLGALPGKGPTIVADADQQWTDNVVRTVTIALPGCLLDLGLAVFQPVLTASATVSLVRSVGNVPVMAPAISSSRRAMASLCDLTKICFRWPVVGCLKFTTNLVWTTVAPDVRVRVRSRLVMDALNAKFTS